MTMVFVGYDPREVDGFRVTENSIRRHLSFGQVRAIHLPAVREAGWYMRPVEKKDGKLWDPISEAPMSTEFALSRFLIPQLAKQYNCKDKWVIFMDCDMLVRCDINMMALDFDDKYAVMCVKHDIEHGEGVKMDGCKQTSYGRKNWSSVMAWNLHHPANKRLTHEMFNSVPGRDLHQFCWLEDHEIGSLDKKWNHLVGLMPENPDAAIVHYTLGIPSMSGYENCEYADEWRREWQLVQTNNISE